MNHPGSGRRSRALALAMGLAGSWVSTGCNTLAETALDGDEGSTVQSSSSLGLFPEAGTWVFRINGAGMEDHVQLIRVADDGGAMAFSTIPSIAGNGTVVEDLRSTSASGTVVAPDSVVLQLRLATGASAELRYRVVADTARGVMIMNGARLEALGVRIDPELIRPARASRPTASATPVVLLRIDDAPGTDRPMLERLRQRSVVAEIAAPSAWVGFNNRLTWNELRAWKAQGFGVAAHSRYHDSGQPRALDFIGEVVGSFSDLRAHGLVSSVFVQPGTWTDSAYFDKPWKMLTWRGSLLRTFSSVFEGYVFTSSVVRPGADTTAYGSSHYTISDGASNENILRQWVTAQQPNRYTTFLIHTGRLTSPEVLDWFLDSLSLAKTSGRIRMISTSSDFYTQ